jgi:hypothetical protein
MGVLSESRLPGICRVPEKAGISSFFGFILYTAELSAAIVEYL